MGQSTFMSLPDQSSSMSLPGQVVYNPGTGFLEDESGLELLYSRRKGLEPLGRLKVSPVTLTVSTPGVTCHPYCQYSRCHLSPILSVLQVSPLTYIISSTGVTCHLYCQYSRCHLSHILSVLQMSPVTSTVSNPGFTCTVSISGVPCTVSTLCVT